MLEDILQREAIVNPHSQSFYWRTSAGAEVDLLLERPGEVHAIEVKTARAQSPYLGRSLRAIMADTTGISATVIDQGEGSDPLASGVERLGFASARTWLP